VFEALNVEMWFLMLAEGSTLGISFLFLLGITMPRGSDTALTCNARKEKTRWLCFVFRRARTHDITLLKPQKSEFRIAHACLLYVGCNEFYNGIWYLETIPEESLVRVEHRDFYG